MALITDAAELGDYLREVIAHVPWEDFSKINNGTIRVENIDFKLRVGLHMKRPMRAIIAIGQFVRVKAAPEFAEYPLKLLTPDAPDTCLYLTHERHRLFYCWSPGGVVEEPDTEPPNLYDSLILDYAAQVHQMMARSKNERRSSNR